MARPLGHNGGMEIKSHQTYNASPDQVFAMMTDEAYLTAVCDRFGATEKTITVEGNKTTVTMGVPAPAQVQKFVSGTMKLRQVVTWGEPQPDGTRQGTLQMSVEKMPVDVAGTAVLHPAGSATQVDYDADMNVKIPLVGKKLEKEAAPYVQKALDAQQQVGEKYLSDRA